MAAGKRYGMKRKESQRLFGLVRLRPFLPSDSFFPLSLLSSLGETRRHEEIARRLHQELPFSSPGEFFPSPLEGRGGPPELLSSAIKKLQRGGLFFFSSTLARARPMPKKANKTGHALLYTPPFFRRVTRAPLFPFSSPGTFVFAVPFCRITNGMSKAKVANPFGFSFLSFFLFLRIFFFFAL